MPHYRLYINTIGGGESRAGTYFPHDEFYDASVRDAADFLASRAGPGARIACETPGLIKHYAQLAGRDDLKPISLSDKEALKELQTGDFILIAQGRRYFSNDAIVRRLPEIARPVGTVRLGDVPAIDIYLLDADTRRGLDGAIDVMSMIRRAPVAKL